MAALFVFALALAPALECGAGTFQVNPIRVDLSNTLTSAAITVRNDGSEAVVVQASVLRWSQRDGADEYAPTTDALVTPPVMTIGAGVDQIVRVGLRNPPGAPGETTYRVFLQEVPPPPKPGFSGLQMSLRISLPVFVVASGAERRPLEWSAKLEADGTLRVRARNPGEVHHQISDFELRVAGDRETDPVANVSSVSYVLAREAREWVLKPRPERVRFASELKLTAYTDAGEIQTAVRLDR